MGRVVLGELVGDPSPDLLSPLLGDPGAHLDAEQVEAHLVDGSKVAGEQHIYLPLEVKLGLVGLRLRRANISDRRLVLGVLDQHTLGASI